MGSDRTSQRRGLTGPLAGLKAEQLDAVVRITLVVHCRNDERRYRALSAVIIEGRSIRMAARRHGVCHKTIARLLSRFRDSLSRATAGGL